MSKEESSQIMPRASSENKLDDLRNKQGDKCSCLKNNKSRDSIILAGSLDKHQCISLSDCNIAKKNYNTTYNNRDTWNISDETSYLLKPDLNKCINLFHNEHLMKDTLEEQLNTTLSETINGNISICHLNRNAMEQRNFNKLSRSMSLDSLESTILPKSQEFVRSKSYITLNKNLKRDTNYNIKADLCSFPKIAMKISCNEEVEKIAASFNALSLKPSLPSRKNYFCSMEDNQRYDSNCEKSSKEELNPAELRIFLHSLVDRNPLKEAATQRIIRRLSANYYDSPKGFTEGLLTIIEESVINDSLQYPEVSLRRFNEELRKMCKFIEDETVPEWPQSPGMSTTICAKRKSQEPKNLSWKFLASGTPNKGLCLTPVSPRRNIKSPKKICRRMSKNTSYIMKNLHDSTNTFENLEAYCEKLYPDEYKTPSSKEKDQLQGRLPESPLRNMDNIRHMCESQMASLEDSFNEKIKKAGTSDSANNNTPEMQNLQQRIMSCEKHNKTDSKKVSDTFKQRTKRSKRHKTNDLNDFEKTLMYEIAKKRQRCLDTAKVMMEIDANLESTEETYPNIVITESSPTTNDDKFIKILKCVKNYQDYLEEHKSLLNLLHETRLNSPVLNSSTSHDKKNVREKICTSSISLGHKSLQTPKFSPRKKSTSPSSTKRRSTNKIVSKPRLFVTPGRTPIKSCRPKRTYFPNLLPGLKQDEPNSFVKKIYRQIGNYDHVVSPVGLYIKGTDSHLKKNLRPKTDETSQKKQTTQLPTSKIKSRLSPEISPKLSKKVSKTTLINIICKIFYNALGIYLVYFALFQKVLGTTVRDKNVADNFSHLKVHDKLPSHVHTVCNNLYIQKI